MIKRDDFSDERRISAAMTAVQYLNFPKPEFVAKDLWVPVSRNMRARLFTFKMRRSLDAFNLVANGLDNPGDLARFLDEVDARIGMRVAGGRASMADVVAVCEAAADILAPGEMDRRLGGLVLK